MRIKAIIITFIIAYVLLSIPAMTGFGYVIDWTAEATLFQKFNGYVVEGLKSHFYLKVVLSFLLSLIIYLFRRRRINHT